MRTAAPVAGMSIIAALAAAIVWQAVNLWRPHNYVWPTARDQLASNAPPTAAAESAQSGSSEKPGAPAVDETALRYFARQGDTRRLNVEIARLRSLYPDWTPPADRLKAPPAPDPQLDRLWRLYSQGEFAQARAAVAERQSADPKWRPPKDLIDHLDLADARGRLVNASNAKQYETVIRIAASTPDLRTCGDVDVLWRLAEALGRLIARAGARTPIPTFSRIVPISRSVRRHSKRPRFFCRVRMLKNSSGSAAQARRETIFKPYAKTSQGGPWRRPGPGRTRRRAQTTSRYSRRLRSTGVLPRIHFLSGGIGYAVATRRRPSIGSRRPTSVKTRRRRPRALHSL